MTHPAPPPSESQTRNAILTKIAQLEARGSILSTDARTLRSQLHDSSSGEWKAVEVRLQQLARSWNPYQNDQKNGITGASTGTELKKTNKKKRDFYELLELQRDKSLTSDDFKRQFRKLALLLHPDKQRTNRKRKIEDEDEDLEEETLRNVDSTQFATLRLAYETLSDPIKRAAYDAKLVDAIQLQHGDEVKGQVKLEASADFASLEWIARVKHKMDVMARIGEWAKLLSLNATELRFETGEACSGRDCGKIVSMDRDLEFSGSPRRRVYICLLHKYVHACDECCTSAFGEAQLDRRVCSMRAYWLIQNWLFDQLQAVAQASILKHEIEDTSRLGVKSEAREPTVCNLNESEIHLGDQYTRFQVAKIAECQSNKCRKNFQFLEDGIYACRRHGTPHICTFAQCDRQELRNGSYVCWVSGIIYGHEREQAGTDVRTRRIAYSGAHGDEHSVEMEVPVMLPLGKTTEYLLEGGFRGDVSSLSPPPPDEKAWNKRGRVDSDGYDRSTDSIQCLKRKRFKCDRERQGDTSPVRKRLRERLASKIQRAETISFHIFLKLPPAVAILPKVALELQDAACKSSDDEDNELQSDNLLQIFVNSNHTVNYIKYWMEELTEQQLSIWDQQIYWGDTLVGEESNVMVLEEHGISAGCVLELRLHDDCPLLASTWNGKNTSVGGLEYNTVLISKEAAEDLDDQQEEWENVGAAEEQAFEESRLKRKREKLELRGAIEHTEVLRYDNSKSQPRLLGVIQKHPINSEGVTHKNRLCPSSSNIAIAKAEKALSIPREVLIKEEQEIIPKQVKAIKLLAKDARPVNEAKKTYKT